MFLFLQLLIFICQYLYINYWFCGEIPNITKTQYHMQGEETATIYRTHRKAKRVILFLSGGYSLEYHFYIKKMIYDLETTYPSIMANYDLVCYENSNKSSFKVIDDVSKYVSRLNNDAGTIEELVIVGFSAGGVVASHIMSQLDELVCRKKIITYNTPYQVHTNVDSFKYNWIFRADIAFFHKVYGEYLNNADPKHLTDVCWNSGSPRMTKMIMDIEGWTFDALYKRTGFNFDQSRDTQVYNIYSSNDPISINDLSEAYIRDNEMRFMYKSVEKDTVGHCSDMAFSTAYLTDIIGCLF